MWQIGEIKLHWKDQIGGLTFLPHTLKLATRFRGTHGASTSDCLRHLVAVCPILKSIKDGGTETTSMSVFMEAYESGNYEIGSLSHYDLLADHNESIVALARMPQDPDSAAANTLRILQLRARSHQIFDESMFKALAEMLQANRTIEYLEVDMSDMFTEAHKAALKRTKGRCIADRPLHPASRRAFLSVLRHYARSSSSMEPPRKRLRLADEVHGGVDFSRLDPNVISSIFAFAAERRSHQVHVHTSRLP